MFGGQGPGVIKLEMEERERTTLRPGASKSGKHLARGCLSLSLGFLKHRPSFALAGAGGGCLDFRNWSLNLLNAPFGGLGGALKRGDRSETAGAGWTLVTTT